jgi:uncharacterized membrane protein YfcA
MEQLGNWIDWYTLMFVGIGFVAQLCDGALGMGFGVISSTVLTLIGLPREIVSATVNGAKILTGTASSVSHLVYRNVRWVTLAYLATGGLIGGLIGAWLLTQGSNQYVGPIVSTYLIFVGIYIIWKTANIERLQITAPRTAGVGVAAGFLEAVAGVWGPLATSNLVAFGLPARIAVGVGNVAETIVAFAVFTVLVNHIGFDQLSRFAVGLVIGALIASPLAAKLTANLPKRRLAIGVGVMVIVSSVLRLVRETGLLGG